MTNQRTGLSSAEASQRLQRFGYNDFSENRLSEVFDQFIKILSDPMGLMLLALGIVYWALGEHHDAIILLISYIPVAGVDVLLELRSQKALRSLKHSLKKTCFVLRDGKTVTISIRDLVPGDLLLLEEGQTFPADGNLVEASHLTVDEASLTGESMPVEKETGNEALSGTTVITGSGVLEITKTGLSSQIGTVAQVLKQFNSVQSPLLRSINKTVRNLFLIAMIIAVIVFLEGMHNSLGFATSLIAALTLAMAAIPEEFPMVFTLYLSMAAYRLSKKGVLVKTLPAVEGLGRVDIICTDKTGTLTEGRFQVEKILTLTPEKPLAVDEARALVFSCESKAVDPMEASVFAWIEKSHGGVFSSETHDQWILETDYPFDTKEKYMSHIWKKQNSEERVIAMKGSVEGVLNHCQLADSERDAILKLADKEAAEGQRLLGFAMKNGQFSTSRQSNELGLKFLGLICFTDPVRPGIMDALRTCVAKGIKIKMLTGDHLLTAHSIADKIGLPHEHDQLFSGPELSSMDVVVRTAAFRRGAIFARLKPEQKLEMIQALKRDGSIVAMTGDGINDAPALKLADVGISMGEQATDVARSTAQLVLLKNDFNGIVASILEGRRVLRSLSQSFGYLIAFHIPIVSIAIFQAFFLRAPILLPIHIVLMELIVHPVSAFVFDEADSHSGERLKTLMNRKKAAWSAARGFILTALCIGVALLENAPNELGRTHAVLLLVMGNIGLLMAERVGIVSALFDVSKNHRAWIASFVLFTFAAMLAFVPQVTAMFSLVQPSILSFAMLLMLGILIGVKSPFSIRFGKDVTLTNETVVMDLP